MFAEATRKPNIYLIDGCRTPFIKAKGKANPWTASDLAVSAGKLLLTRQSFAPSLIDEVIMGCVMPSPNEANIGRIIALRLGCPVSTPAWTVQRNCASGLQSIDNAYKDILIGRCQLVLAGGTEAMSHAPLLFKQVMVNWFADLNKANTLSKKIAVLLRWRPQFIAPVIALLKGLTDPLINQTMGQTAEQIAYEFNVNRQDMDTFAVESNQKASKAQSQQLLKNIEPLFDDKGHVFTEDNGVRADSTIEKLKQLKPMFDRKFGNITAANSSQVTDGAALGLFAHEEFVKTHKLTPLCKIVDIQWAGLNPEKMGLGPVYAISKLLDKNKIDMNEIDYWEINEAFAGQVLACLRAMTDRAFCKNELKRDSVLGEIQKDKLNLYGGAIAVGHPVGASGARIVLNLAEILKNKKARFGIATLCIGGGQGGAVLIENTERM